MNKLDDELFNFITQPSNWTIAREIYERVEYAKTRLLKEFKQDVVEKIKTSMNLQEYKIDTPDPGRIQIKHTSWNNLFSIDYGNLHSKAYLGVWCDTQKEIILKSYEHISNAMKAADKKLTGKDAQWYPAWYYTGDNFSQLSTFDHILPENKQYYIDKYVQEIIDVKDTAKSIIENDDLIRKIVEK